VDGESNGHRYALLLRWPGLGSTEGAGEGRGGDLAVDEEGQESKDDSESK